MTSICLKREFILFLNTFGWRLLWTLLVGHFEHCWLEVTAGTHWPVVQWPLDRSQTNGWWIKKKPRKKEHDIMCNISGSLYAGITYAVISFLNIRSKVLVIFASLALTRLKYHIGAHDFHVKESKHNIIQIATKKKSQWMWCWV